MRIELKTAAIAAMLMTAALSASAEMAASAVNHDPLIQRILSMRLTQPGAGVTGSTRLGSGEVITLEIADPLAPLKPAEGLVAKPAKAEPKDAKKARRKTRRPDEQLRRMSQDERKADWVGRP